MNKKNLYHILFAIALLTLSTSIFFLEQWAQKNFRPIPFSTEIADRLRKENPDIVCIGNSTVGINIVKPLFEKELSEFYGKKIKVSYVTAGGMHSAWQYLIIKNQIAQSGLKNIPIIIVDYEDFFLRPDAKTATSGKSEMVLRKIMQQEEGVFLKKIGSQSAYFTTGFPYLYSQRFQIKRHLVSSALIQFMKATRADTLVHSRRWKQKGILAVQWLLGTLYKGSNFRSGQSTPEERTDRSALIARSTEELQNLIEKSFLPDMLEYKDRFRFIFVLSNSNPNMPLMKQSVTEHAAQLEQYFKSQNVKFIDMNRVPELQAPGLMHDSRHFTKGHPRELNTKMLLQELRKPSVLKD